MALCVCICAVHAGKTEEDYPVSPPPDALPPPCPPDHGERRGTSAPGEETSRARAQAPLLPRTDAPSQT